MYTNLKLISFTDDITMKDISGNCVATLSTVQLLQRSSPFVFIIEVSQHMDSFISATYFGYSLSQTGWPDARL